MRSRTLKQTEYFAERIAKTAKRGVRNVRNGHAMVVALVGELGAGKTVFARGFARGLGIKRRITSPTFVLARRYKIPNQKSKIKNQKAPLRWLWHFDCYRLRNEHDLAELGFHEIIRDPHAIVLIEWADRIKAAIPRNAVWIFFRHKKRGREIVALNAKFKMQISKSHIKI